ncbi:GNAT family N-acetyltransferase [Ornithinibacillus contaminans]|uniref:GNAT family N-acetyltransferase n=1 Tax=Ornithinibacillus contaminans TaxID=694055 RepID=UPI0007EDE1DC|nr:GNAT family N-acetyltransferase [Ornithinibacillus contaminans]
MNKFPVLYTKRLQLVEIDHRFTDAFYRILSRDEVTKYYGRDSLKSVDEAADLIDSFQVLFKEGRGFRWGIIVRESDEFIGTIGIHHYNSEQKRAEIGFELHPNHWRKGIITEAIEKVLDYCFQELSIYRIGAITFPANTASNRLLEKVGFTREGSLRGYIYQHNQSHDAHVLSLIKPDWMRKKYHMEAPIQYTDHMTEIIKRSEAAGDFDNLPGKGKPLNLGRNYTNPSEAQLYKTLKDNHILPAWVELANEIDQLKEKLVGLEGKERRKLVKEINKKIKAYNYACPPSLQRNKVSE